MTEPEWNAERACWTIGETANGKHFIEVIPQMFNFRLVVTPKDLPTTYDDMWCYKGLTEALLNAMMWDGNYPETEPMGWFRHPPTGRRRDDGDPSTEYVLP